jgi:ABC-2 type transport system ATP-binding protein
VKFFSSGMLVRLGFAVAVHVDPDVLLIDEVLAVGDEAFQKRCLDKIKSFQAEGRTIVLVTHALDTVVAVCDRAVMLEHGRVHMQGTPMDVVAELRHRLLRDDPDFVPEEGSREVEIRGVEILPDGRPGQRLKPGQDLVVQVDIVAREPVSGVDAAFAVVSAHTNEAVLTGRMSDAGGTLGSIEGERRVRFRIPATEWIGGRYFVTIGLTGPDGRVFHVQTQRYSFEALEAERLPVPLPVSARFEVEEP